MGDPIAPILAIPAEQRSEEQRKQLRDHYFTTSDSTFAALLAEADKLGAVEKKLRDQHKTTSMIMQDEVKNPRMTYVLDRGQYRLADQRQSHPGGCPDGTWTGAG